MATTDLSQTGRTELRRRLTLRSNAALVFASVGATAGLYSLFAFSLGTSGPSFIWGWVATVIGVAALCCMWAELAAHYPLAGAFYHWGTAVAGSRVGGGSAGSMASPCSRQLPAWTPASSATSRP